METLQIMPVQNQSRFNLGEYAEEATLVEEIAAPKRVNHFIEANTEEATLNHKTSALLQSFLRTMNLPSIMPHLLKPSKKQLVPSLVVREWSKQTYVAVI